MIRERRRDLAAFERSPDEVRGSMRIRGNAYYRRAGLLHSQHRARFSLRSRAAPVRDRLQRHRGPARPDLLRLACVGSAPGKFRRYRHAPRIAGALVQTGPAHDRRGAAPRARLMERVDVRVPHAAARDARLSAHASERDLPCGDQPAHRVRKSGRRSLGHLGVGLQRAGRRRQTINIAPSACPASD